MKVVGLKVSATSRLMQLKCLATEKIYFGKHWLSTQVGYRPRRSLLYVPGSDAKKVQKAALLNADVVVLDCEDGVALPMKVGNSSRVCYNKYYCLCWYYCYIFVIIVVIVDVIFITGNATVYILEGEVFRFISNTISNILLINLHVVTFTKNRQTK